MKSQSQGKATTEQLGEKKKRKPEGKEGGKEERKERGG